MPELPRAGLTSVAVPAGAADLSAFYRVAGFHVCGPRAVRIDMLERLADLIRPLLGWRPDSANPSAPPKGATGDGAFKATPDMISILGCSAGELGHVLKALGFWAERRAAAPQVEAEASLPPPAEAAAAAVPSNGTGEAGDAATGAAEPPTVSLAPVPEQPPEAAGPTPAAPSVPEAAAERWEEIWRPRRKGRAFEPERNGRAQPERRKEGAHGTRRRPEAPARARPASRPPAKPLSPARGQGPAAPPRRASKAGEAARRAAASPNAGASPLVEDRVRSRFAVRSAELPQGGSGEAQPGLRGARVRSHGSPSIDRGPAQ